MDAASSQPEDLPVGTLLAEVDASTIDVTAQSSRPVTETAGLLQLAKELASMADPAAVVDCLLAGLDRNLPRCGVMSVEWRPQHSSPPVVRGKPPIAACAGGARVSGNAPVMSTRRRRSGDSMGSEFMVWALRQGC